MCEGTRPPRLVGLTPRRERSPALVSLNSDLSRLFYSLFCLLFYGRLIYINYLGKSGPKKKEVRMKKNNKSLNKKIYLDYAASTPVDREVLQTMEPYFSVKFGNPGSLHSFGQEAITAVDKSREKIAQSINADFREIIFTGSATEANNLMLRGIVEAFSVERLAFSQKNKTLNPKPYTLNSHIIVSAIEHESILETVRDIEKRGVARVSIIPVNKNGIVDLKKLKKELNERTILLSVMYANNEIVTIQPIAEIAKIIEEYRIQNIKYRKNKDKKSSLCSKSYILNPIYPLLHTDAVQTFQFLDCDVQKLGVDLMTLSAHKIYGPKGIGVLYVRSLRPTPHILHPIITGGGQEFGLRSGTENVPAIVGFAKAVELAVKNREKETKRIAELTNYFWKELKKIYPKAKLNGIMNNSFLPNILNIYFPNQNAQDLLTKLDLNGITVSSGSACSTRSTQPS